jgi:hypothetical protein
MPATGADGVARYGNETRPPTRLSGGLFNQLWALQGLVMDAYESKLPLILPSWDSHLFPAYTVGSAHTQGGWDGRDRSCR